MSVKKNSAGVIYIDTFLQSDQILNLYNDQLQRHTAIINASCKSSYVPSHWGPTSLKFTIKGEEKYNVYRRQYAVDKDQFLILNEGSEYATVIDSDEDVNIFTINFAGSSGFHSFPQKDLTDVFIDESGGNTDPSLDFIERLYNFDTSWKSDVFYIKELVESRFDTATMELDERLTLLYAKLISSHNNCLSETSELLLKKKSSRIELYRRLCYVKDYILTNFKTELSLKELSLVGLLSEFYLIRHFKQLFRLTPFEYLIQVRLLKAYEMIAYGDLPIHEICNLVGYNDHSSFSKLFKKHFHYPPARLRSLTRN